jgi:putative nucleotidyltransferase with HDIG domain
VNLGFRKKRSGRSATSRELAVRKPRRLPVFHLLLAGTLWAALVLFFYSGRLLRPQPLTLGQQAPATLAASVEFRAENLDATQTRQRTAATAVLPVFYIDLSAIENVRQMLSTEQLVRILPEGDTETLREVLFSAISNTVACGIISAADLQTGFNGAVPAGKLALRGNPTDTIRTLESFVLQSDALRQTLAAVLPKLPREQRNEDTLRALIAPGLLPNLIYDPAETAARRVQASGAIDPAIEPVPAGTILIRSGATVNAQTLLWLEAHEKQLSELETPTERIQRLVGNGLLLLLGLSLTAALAGVVHPELLRSRRQAVLLMSLSILPLAAGKALLYATVDLRLLPPSVLLYALPLSIAPLLGAILLGTAPGLIVGFWVSFALAALLGGQFDVLVLGLLATIAAIYTTRDVKRRTALFRAGFWIGAVKILFALVTAVLKNTAWQILLPQLGAALLCGLLSALLALLLIPLLEHLFKITTDITLLELSDLSHPLLQSLAINAPGTYHHSLMLASLAQNAAEAIGANGLLLRVCAYFHDIGKLVKPGFFSENIQFTENPHDELTPSMSTLVIVSHVKEGVLLARKHKLPQVIIDGIEQHQGTGLVSVFYHRAKTLQKESGNDSATAINAEDYRYEGPKPQTREMAILMLADGCEAASRSLEKPTPLRVSNLISDFFDARLRDGQLNECNLTLAELNRIKESFIFSLTSMLHGRVAYPKDDGRLADPPQDEPGDSR